MHASKNFKIMHVLYKVQCVIVIEFIIIWSLNAFPYCILYVTCPGGGPGVGSSLSFQN